MARALAVLVLAALVAPAAATAHARLLRTLPADGAAVARSPRQVLVTFDDTVRVAPGNAVVANSSRRSVLAGPAGAHGRTLTLPLRTGLPHGAYTVRWSIVSEDGHREQGVIAFAVGAGAAPPEPVLAASAPARTRDVALRAVYYFGLLVAAGTTVFALLARGLLGARLRRPLAGLLFLSLLVTFVGASGLAAGAASGTRFDVVLKVAVLLSLVGAASAALAPVAAPLLAVSGACALALAAAPALSGHALDHDQPSVLAPLLDVAHTLAAAVWLGGLVAAFWLLPRASRDTWERRAVLRRFSSAAMIAVAVLAATGLGRALTELGALDHLWTTSYGRALLVKTLLFALLLVLGRRSRTLLEQRSPRLARSIAMEIAAIALIVVVVAVLTQLRPASEAPDRRAGLGRVTVPTRIAADRFAEARSVLERREPRRAAARAPGA